MNIKKLFGSKATTVHVQALNSESSSSEQHIESQVQTLQVETAWFTTTLRMRLAGDYETFELAAPDASTYSELVENMQLDTPDRIMLLTVFALSWKNRQIVQDLKEGQDTVLSVAQLRALGFCLHAKTGRLTATPIAIAHLAGAETEAECEVILAQLESSKLIQEGVILPYSEEAYALFHEQELRIDQAYYRHLIHGKRLRLDQTEHFPADLLETNKTLKDLFLNDKTLVRLQTLIDYLRKMQEFQNDPEMHRHIKPGYVTLFHGYPGTGKSLAASIIGQELGIPTYRINLARVVSKYIGETEKNLDAIFNKLQNKKCILFFDEADSLFGKRTQVSEAKDRYANQEVSHLLQRIEELNFTVILATNFAHNMDAAFRRRINLNVKMDFPDEGVRLKLWNHYFPHHRFTVEPENLLEKTAQEYSVTGANIANIVKQACTDAFAKETTVITESLLLDFLNKEYFKEGRNISNPHHYSWEALNNFK